MSRDAGILLTTVLPMVGVALLMVLAMVRWTEGLLAAEPGPRHRAWGIAYAGAWAVIVALAARLVGQSADGWTPTNAGLLVLCAGGYWGFHWFFVWAARAIARADARAAAERAAGWREASELEEPEEPAADADAPPGAPAPAPAAPPASRPGAIRRVLQPVGMVLGALVVIGIGEALPALRALEGVMARHRAAWLLVTLGPAILGWILLMAGAIRMALRRGERMSPRQVAEMQASLRRTPGTAGRMAYRVFGKAVGAQGADEASFSEVKAAWRARAWRYSPRWRWLFAMMLGGMLMLVGGFGAVVVLATPGIKLLFGGALAYALVQITRGFLRA
jgi:hypothetical protein